MLVRERFHRGPVRPVARIGERRGRGRGRVEIAFHRLRVHAGIASGAPITATTSTDLSSGTSKKLITGVSGRPVLTSLRIATRIAGWTTSANRSEERRGGKEGVR